MEPPRPIPRRRRPALDGGGYVFVLELATLRRPRLGKGTILNCDDHANFIRRHGKQPGDHRPTFVIRRCWQSDSPLNKAGGENVYVNTQKNVLFAVAKDYARTFKRFLDSSRSCCKTERAGE